ncbi:VOC family protein [Pseudomonas sp. REB1044]|uniref:VOC family protein n=1 Tax=Pseudomonas sp. REB1044 TaxID=2675224 RepID=UPI00315C54AE
MALHTLAHYSIRTTDLQASRRFYIDVMGLREGYRPPFDFPGVWLYLGDDEQQFGVVHIIGIDADNPHGLLDYLGGASDQAEGTGTLDHIAFLATDLQGFHQRLKAAGHRWRDRLVPSLGLHQLFVEDPSGVTLELNFPASEAIAAGLDTPR